MSSSAEVSSQVIYAKSDVERHRLRFLWFTFGLRRTVVENFLVLVKFIRLFSESVAELRLAYTHDKPKDVPVLPPMDGHILFNAITWHMPHLRDFHFEIYSACFSDKQMQHTVQSFRTRESHSESFTFKDDRLLYLAYWMNKLISCYYTKQNDLCVMFSLTYMFPGDLVMTSDMMNMQFNQAERALDIFTSELFNRVNRLILYPVPQSTIHAPLLHLLSGGAFLGQ